MNTTMNANRFALPAQSLGLIAVGLQRNARRRVPAAGVPAERRIGSSPLTDLRPLRAAEVQPAVKGWFLVTYDGRMGHVEVTRTAAREIRIVDEGGLVKLHRSFGCARGSPLLNRRSHPAGARGAQRQDGRRVGRRRVLKTPAR